MPHATHETVDVWSVEGQFQHLIYSPRGGIEGVLIDTDGVPTQFVFEHHDEHASAPFEDLQAGQSLVIEGTQTKPSPKGEAQHTVYRFERLASVDGKASHEGEAEGSVDGTVVRFNHARHGEANGVVLDSGDFVHTRPDGLAPLGLKIGDKVQAKGRARNLVDGAGRVIDAVEVNGIGLRN